ncbi:MAG: serine/threonine-protein phosphatase 6 regulatory ankyrin repeat subunit A-like isoform [Verrucomicrobiales bacterium]|nr:serine/threonine-protein phosphatase 6 regulatory ankyrin repeat subunit A-like isoform [Verrucomicrobiales bacterium]
MKFWPAVLALALIVQGCVSKSPLHQAVAKGDKAKVATLLEQGAKIDSRDSRGCTPLFIAAENGDADSVKELLAHGANPNKGALLKHGNTPLHVAAQRGFDKVIELLLTKYTNADLRNSAGQTPLMLAAWARHPQTVTLLIKNGANPSAYDRYGWAALHTPWNAKPADSDYTAVMEILVANKARINAKTGVPFGYTPIMGAAMAGDKETVELLLDAGAKVNDADEHGQTALSYAEHKHYEDVVAVLSEHGAMQFNPVAPEQLQEPIEPMAEEADLSQ